MVTLVVQVSSLFLCWHFGQKIYTLLKEMVERDLRKLRCDEEAVGRTGWLVG